MAQPDPSPEQFESPPHPVLRRAAVYPDNQQPPEPESYYQADRYDDVLYGRRPDEQPAYAYGDHVPRDAYEGQFPRETYTEAPFGYENDYEEDEPAPGRRGKMATVVAVLLLAVVGTGAAYAYRTFVGSAPKGEPPVIRANTEPNKIVPQHATSGDAVGKLLQDRMSTENGTEQMVSREEQPVNVKDAVNAGPRVVFPPLNQNGHPPSAASVAPSIKPPATAANGTIAGDEPHRVRTLTVRGDPADLTAAAVARPEVPPNLMLRLSLTGIRLPQALHPGQIRLCRCHHRLPNRAPEWLRPIRPSRRRSSPVREVIWSKFPLNVTRRTRGRRSGTCRVNFRCWDRTLL